MLLSSAVSQALLSLFAFLEQLLEGQRWQKAMKGHPRIALRDCMRVCLYVHMT
jgi:hypothetical protein